MGRLFDRRIILRVETVEITGLRISFSINKTVSPEPNTAEVSVWGLSDATRRSLAKQKNARVQLLAGYRDNVAQIYLGELRVAGSTREGPDWVTRLESGDGEVRSRTARINKSFAKATYRQILSELSESLGVGLGNAAEMAAKGEFQGAIGSLTKGVVLKGQVVRMLDRIARSSGFDWSIQDGQLQFLPHGQALQRTAVSLTPETGLLGSPEVGEDGVVTARCLLQPSIMPGRKVHIRSREIDGFFRADRVTMQGDSRARDWYTEIEGVPV